MRVKFANRFAWMFAIGTALLCVFFSLLFQNSTNPPPVSSSNRITSNSNNVNKGTKPTGHPSKASESIDSISKAFKGRQQSLDAMIARSSDKIGAITASFLISFDPYYLDQLKVWPNSTLCAMLISSFDTSPNTRLEWAKKLETLDPNGAMAPLIKATISLELNDSENAKQSWSIAIQKNKVDLAQQEIKTHIHAAWKELGYSDEIATKLTIKNRSAYSLSGVIETASEKIWKHQKSVAKTDDDLVESASQQLHFIDMLRRSRQPDSRMDITSFRLEADILNSLPQDAEFGRADYTVTDRLKDLAVERQTLSSSLDIFKHVYHSATSSNLSKYNTIYLLQGEQAARKWLIEASQPRKAVTGKN